MRVRPALLLLLALAGTPAAHATNLLDAWRAAAAHDPSFAAARAAHSAGQARREQAASLWRPNVALQAAVGAATQESSTRGARFSAPGFGESTGVGFDTSVTGGTSTRYALSLRQPLYGRERSAEGEQLKLAADMAEIEWRNAQQQLMLRVADRYFDAALAAQQLRLLAEQERAAEAARTEAADRFRIGDKPVTDVHEAEARAAALRAQRLAAQADLELRRTLLADLMGAPPDGAFPLPDGAGAGALEPLEAWLERAASGSPQVLLAQAQVELARQDARKSAGALSPTVDLVAQVGRERLSGSGDFGAAGNLSLQRAVGVQLNVPLYTGGWRSARHTEAVALEEKARAEHEQARQQARQQARSAWLDLSVGRSRIEALESGRRASLARLDATRVGLQAGDRTTLDLLNAQNDAAAAELALLQARVRQLTQRLRLAAAAGALDEPLLAAVQRELGAGEQPPARN